MSKSPLRSASSALKVPSFDPTAYATKNLPADDVMKLKQCFDIFDSDRSGNISMDQLSTAIKVLGLEKQASKILHIVSVQSQEEEMDFETFLNIFGFNSESNSESSLQQLFEIFDKHNVGSFGVEEFMEVCENVGERFSVSEIEQMIDFADKDRDSRISYKQFVDIVTKQYPPI